MRFRRSPGNWQSQDCLTNRFSGVNQHAIHMIILSTLKRDGKCRGFLSSAEKTIVNTGVSQYNYRINSDAAALA